MEIEEEQNPQRIEGEPVAEGNLTQAAEQANDCIPILINLDEANTIDVEKTHDSSGLSSDKPVVKSDNMNQTKSRIMKHPTKNKKRISELK